MENEFPKPSSNTNIRYTYVVAISNLDETWKHFEKRAKYTIKKYKGFIRVSNDLVKFNYFHSLSRLDRIIDFDFICNTYKSNLPTCRIYASDTAMAMISWKDDTAYYLLAGRDKLMKPDGSPTAILWRAMQDLNKLGITKFDLCGCNKLNTELFKRQFGGKKIIQKTPCLNY